VAVELSPDEQGELRELRVHLHQGLPYLRSGEQPLSLSSSEAFLAELASPLPAVMVVSNGERALWSPAAESRFLALTVLGSLAVATCQTEIVDAARAPPWAEVCPTLSIESEGQSIKIAKKAAPQPLKGMAPPPLRPDSSALLGAFRPLGPGEYLILRADRAALRLETAHAIADTIR
jgi:hypothetical protein